MTHWNKYMLQKYNLLNIDQKINYKKDLYKYIPIYYQILNCPPFNPYHKHIKLN
jgi:hypothetical protein